MHAGVKATLKLGDGKNVKPNIDRYWETIKIRKTIFGYACRCESNIEIGRWEMHPHPASVAAANSADPKIYI